MKKQGYNSRMDEMLGMKNGKESKKKQSMASRRKESEGMRKAMGKSPMGLKSKAKKKK